MVHNSIKCVFYVYYMCISQGIQCVLWYFNTQVYIFHKKVFIWGLLWEWFSLLCATVSSHHWWYVNSGPLPDGIYFFFYVFRNFLFLDFLRVKLVPFREGCLLDSVLACRRFCFRGR